VKRALGALFFSLMPALALAAGECAPDRLDIRGDWGTARFTVEIADDEAERAEGLMFRESLGAAQGMLFIYDHPGSPSFWMKNTLISLDMLFITPEGQVQYVKAGAQPGDLSPVNGGEGVIAVLEIRGGMAGALGIGPGDELRHPAFELSHALWPCEGQ
jgi:uncharacterized membrane protein (UPF0127 family)